MSKPRYRIRPGFYVLRSKGSTTIMVESRPFTDRELADKWCAYLAEEHPTDDVFVVDRR